MVGAKHFLAGVAQGRMTQVMEQGSPWAGLDVLPWLFAIVGIWIFTGRSGR